VNKATHKRNNQNMHEKKEKKAKKKKTSATLSPQGRERKRIGKRGAEHSKSSRVRLNRLIGYKVAEDPLALRHLLSRV